MPDVGAVASDALLMAAATAPTPQTGPGAVPTAVRVLAAGSLRAALTELGTAFESTAGGSPVQFTFGASGLLKDRLLAGEPAELFASANMAHPQAVAAAGKALAPVAFTRNSLCVLATPDFSLQGRSLAQRLLDTDVKVGISTPGADPSGDYAFMLFERAESSGTLPAGATAALKAKALQLTGGPGSPPPPAGRNVYGMLVAQGQADAFVTYCTNATLARREHPGLQVLPVPAAIDVSAQYGMALMNPPSPAARRFFDFVLGPQGQAVLASHGFGKP